MASGRRQNLPRRLGAIATGTVFAASTFLGSLATPAPVAAVTTPVIASIPTQYVNGGSATTPGLPENVARFAVEWSDPDAGQTHEVRVRWGDGSADEVFANVTSPHTVEHSYPATGHYLVNVWVTDSTLRFDTVQTRVVVADMSSGAHTKLYSSNLTSSQRFGQAVHLADGMAIVGEPNFSTSRGRVHVYTTPDDGERWQLHQTLATTPTVAGIGFGTAIDRDGSIMAVGARAAFRPDGVRTGAVYIFEEGIDGTWSQTQILYPVIGNDSGDFGLALAIDDGRLAVGAPRRNLAGDRRGVVHLFERGTDGLWAETGEVTSPSQADLDFFGTAVDLLGTDLAVGAPGGSFNPSNLNGKVFVYPWPIGGPPASPAFVHGGPINGTNGQTLGASVALSGGDTLVVGAPSVTGRIHVMHYGGGDLVISDTLPPENETHLGQSVAIDGDLIAGHSNGTHSRPVTLFRRTGTGWVRAGVLTPDVGSTASLNNALNRRVAIADGFILSGQDNDSDLGTDHGAALIWEVPDFVAPPPPSVTVDPDQVDIAQEVVVTATASDEATGGSAISSIEYRLDGGDWLPMDPVDGAFDTANETAEVAVSFATGGIHEVCARATDLAGNVGDPGCTEVQVDLGDTIPLTVTITTVELLGSALDDGLDTADLYAKVSLFLPFLDLELSNRDDANSTAIGVPENVYWALSQDVPADIEDVSLAIGIFHRDDEGPGSDDLADINPAPDAEALSLTVDMSSGTWPGAPLAQTCTEGEGGIDSNSVRVCVAVSVLSETGDLDGDALLDAWELYGYDADGDGVADLDLPGWGAHPERKDLFVEIDCLSDAAHSHCPFEDSVELIAQTFADGAVDNLDGTSGVQLHLDVGALFGAGRVVPIAGAGGAVSTYGDFGGGNEIPEAGNEIVVFEPVGDEVDTDRGQAILNSDPPWTRFGDLKGQNFDALRPPVFRYSLWGHGTAFRKFDGTDCTSGLAERISSDGTPTPGRIADDHLVTLGEHRDNGGPCFAADVGGSSVGSVAQQAGTFIHEFAHNLGLAHGGTDEENRKPNHRSVLNYAFGMQFCRVTVSAGGPRSCDLSREVLPALDENSFDECLGFDSGGPLGPVNVDRSVELGGGPGGTVIVLPTFQGESCGNGSSNIEFDLNDDGDLTLLHGSDDWAAINYEYRNRPVAYGDSVFDGGPTPELLEEARAYLDAMSAPSLLVTVPAALEVVAGQELTIDVGLHNVGNGAALLIAADASAPDGSSLTDTLEILRIPEAAAVSLAWITSEDDIGSHAVDVVVTYHGQSGTAFEERTTVNVTVLAETPDNSPPVALDDEYTTDEDTTLVVAAPGVLANDTDADDDPLSAVLETGSANGTLSLNADGSFTYTAHPDFHGLDTFTYRADDGQALSDPATVTITVSPVNDPPVADAGPDQSVTVGVPVTLDGSGSTDPDGDPLTYAWVLTAPAGSSAALSGADTASPAFTPDVAGDYTIELVVDDGSLTDSDAVTVRAQAVPNSPPVAVDDAYTTEEDTALVVAAALGVLANDTDADGDPLSAVLVTGPANGSLALAADGSFTYTPDAGFNGSDSFTYTGYDGTEASNVATVTITVTEVNPPGGDDVGPTTSLVEITPNPVAAGGAVAVSALVDDGATGGSAITGAEYSIDGGAFVALSASDGAFDAVAEAVAGAIPAVYFPLAAVYDVCVRGSDAAGNAGVTSCVLLAVYDPDGGFVTGGGWIESPPGAYLADPEASGRANFGFVSKYKKGRSVPDGQTQFTFVNGNLRFQSTAYEFLIINKGDARAQFKGSGTINGSGDYRFTIWTTDGGSGGSGDRFRIRIWEELGDVETVIYDNGTDQPLSGGSITIHNGR